MAKTRGRPVAVNWNAVTPELLDLREKGATYQDCADYLADTYHATVAPQTIRGHLRDAGEPSAPPPAPRPALTERETSTLKDRIYEYLLEHPAATLAEIADGSGVSHDAVIALHEAVKAERPGYYITPVRGRNTGFTMEEMFQGLRDAMDSLGVPEGSSMSVMQYRDWRNDLPADERKIYPSPMAYRRKFGTWGNAMEAAGLPVNEKHRDYEGTSRDTAVLWLAHFLRDLRGKYPYMVAATENEYRQWLRTNEQAPSTETLRITGTWGELVNEAAELERSTRDLPESRAVWTGGRNKRARGVYANA